jgi:cytochrome c oxidase subunit III
MTEARYLDVSGLPAYEISNKSTLFWGQLLMAAIEGSLFLMMIAIYFYLRISVDIWPPPGVQLPHLTMPTLALIPLALSCVGSWWASEGAKEDDWHKMLTGLMANLGLALVFLAMRAVEWHTLNFKWSTDIHGSIVWSLLFLHTFDAIADLVYTLVLIVILLLNYYGPKQRIGVHVDSVLWYFIAGIWIPMYVVIYWGPRFVGAP